MVAGSRRRSAPAWTERGRSAAGYYTKRIAEAWLRDVPAQAREGTLPGMVRTGVTFADACDEYLRYVEVDLDRKPSTVVDYRSIICAHLLPEFGALRLEDLTADRIEAWNATIPVGNRTEAKILICTTSNGPTRWSSSPRRSPSSRGSRPRADTLRRVEADEGYFGERVAAVYDEYSGGMFDPAVVGPAVEMLAELAGDGEFSLVYLVFNTIFNLVTQDGQVACFENAAAHLRSGGRFVIEARVPELQRLPPGQTVLPWRADPDGMSYYVYDVVTQRLGGQHYHLVDGRVQASPTEMRYAWPAELDLMVRLAGMRLRDRWAGWRREPFTAVSPSHVSVYEKP